MSPLRTKQACKIENKLFQPGIKKLNYCEMKKAARKTVYYLGFERQQKRSQPENSE